MHWIFWVAIAILSLYLFPVLIQLLGALIVFLFTLAGKAVVIAIFVVVALGVLWVIFGGLARLFAWIGHMTAFWGRRR